MGALRTDAIVRDLRAIGLAAGDRVLVHSSLRSLGEVDEGPHTVIEALADCVGPGGTVMFPALTGSPKDSPDRLPFCDARKSPTWCGAIPNAALSACNRKRSLHPTHSAAAIGLDASALTAGHELAQSPCGNGSPYNRLAEMGGKVLLLGVSHTSNTTFHTAEELSGAPYVSYPGAHPAHVIDNAGRTIVVRTAIHRWDRPRDFERWSQPLAEAGIVRFGSVGAAPSRLMRSDRLIGFLLARLAEDPRALLAPGTPCP